MVDFIEEFMEWTEGIPSPQPFRLWSAITCVAGALERRVWIETSKGILFPNLFVMLIGPPGVGKSQAISRVDELWNATKGIRVAPDSMTSASMIDCLKDATRIIIGPDGQVKTEFNGLLIAADEFIVFCPAYDLDFLGRLTAIFDNRPRLRVSRKYYKEEAVVKNPYMTMLTGAQPGILKSLFPDEAWSGGFTSRLIMIYCGEGPQTDLFGEAPSAELPKELSEHLKLLVKLYGRFFVETNAGNRLQEWWRAGGPPKPIHSKLSYYCTRRGMHALKLSLIASASRDAREMKITLADVERALEWLFEAERNMPDTFRAMVGKSDGEVLRELHYFMWQVFSRSKKPIHQSTLVNFLADRVPQEKVIRIIELAELGKKIKQVGPRLYEPTPLSAVVSD